MKIRPAKPEDAGFVSGYWSASYRRSRWAGTVPNHLWHEVHGKLMDGLRARGAQTLVAAADFDDDQLLGFLVYESGVVHYLFVKEIARRRGIARSLLAHAGLPARFRYTCRTPDAAYFPGATYAPEIARREHPPRAG